MMMIVMMPDDDVLRFGRLIDALRPCLPHVVIVGGWAHRLYRQHPLAQPVPHEPLITLDADILLPERSPDTTTNIRALLLAHGFEEDLSGEDTPPVADYRLLDDDKGFYVEFLMPLTGSTVTRKGKRDVTGTVMGVTAEKLRHVDLLLASPWSITLDASALPSREPARVLIPNAAAYIVQKLLIHGLRKPEDRAKDVLYIHDTVELFGASLDEVETIWLTLIKPSLSPKKRAGLRASLDDVFSDVNDTIREAAVMAAGRELTADALRETSAAGLARILSNL
jgi:hypothetical protein